MEIKAVMVINQIIRDNTNEGKLFYLLFLLLLFFHAVSIYVLYVPTSCLCSFFFIQKIRKYF